MEQDLKAFTTQLDKMRAAMLLVTGKEERRELENVVDQLEELIGTIKAVHNEQGPAAVSQLIDDAEYQEFNAEMALLEQEVKNSNNKDTPSVSMQSEKSSSAGDNDNDVASKCEDISEELTDLTGLKCLAPHEVRWGEIGYYPAMVFEVLNNNETDDSSYSSLSQINCKIIFLQPVVESQLLCPFFKEDRCKFTDDTCKYSHGEIVPFSKLRDYSEPDYSKVVPSAKVLAKFSDDLWYNATVINLGLDGQCKVQFDVDEEIFEIDISDIVPLDSEVDSEIEESVAEEGKELNDDNNWNLSNILTINSSSEVLGEWEQHTKGFGSKLMMKLGYIMGNGLGKQSEGRVIPVDGVMVPKGMSLDTFMDFKEKKTRMGQPCSSVEKLLKRSQKKHALKEQKLAESRKSESSVFDFINLRLSLRKNSKMKKLEPVSVSKQSCKLLKKDFLTIGEDVRKVEKDIALLRQSIKRAEGRDPTTEAIMRRKLEELEKKRQDLVSVENNILKEQKCRSDKKKLTEF